MSTTEASAALVTYGWWDQVPEGLHTKTQLREKKLKPGGPVRAYIEYGRGHKYRHYDLYSAAEALEIKPPTPRQQAALQKAHVALRTCKRCGTEVESRSRLITLEDRDEAEYYAPYDIPSGVCGRCANQLIEDFHRRNRDEAILWARRLVQSGDFLLLDTAATSKHNGQIIEIVVATATGETLFDSLIRPTSRSSYEPKDEVEAAIRAMNPPPYFCEVWYPLMRLLRGRVVVSYNAFEDRRRVEDGIEESLFDLFEQDKATSQERWNRQTAAMDAAKAWMDTLVEWGDIERNFAQYYGSWNDDVRHHYYRTIRFPNPIVGASVLPGLERLHRMAQAMTSAEIAAEEDADTAAQVARWEGEGGASC